MHKESFSQTCNGQRWDLGIPPCRVLRVKETEVKRRDPLGYPDPANTSANSVVSLGRGYAEHVESTLLFLLKMYITAWK